MLYKFARIFCKALMFLMKVKITGKDKISNAGNCLICSNHISANDPPFIGSLFPYKVNYLAKVELFRNPFIAKILLSLNAIPVRRGRVDRFALKEVAARLEKGQSVVIFPEGTRRSAKVKAGIGKFALEMKKDILPIYLENSDDILGCIFGKKKFRITIGDYIRANSFSHMEANRENYHKLAEEVMEKINELQNSDQTCS